jgi:hypothetical protein
MTLSRAKHFTKGIVVGFVLGFIFTAFMCGAIDLLAAFLLWEQPEFPQVNGILLRLVVIFAASIALFFATSKEWWEDYKDE